MTDTFDQCPRKYMPDAYLEYDTQCGKPNGHVEEHVTKFKIPLVLDHDDEKLRKAIWSDIITLNTTGGEEGMVVSCDCGWTLGPAVSVVELGLEAFKHSEDTGHVLRRYANV